MWVWLACAAPTPPSTSASPPSAPSTPPSPSTPPVSTTCHGLDEALALPRAEPALAAASAVIYGTQGDALGSVLAVGVGGDGAAWLASRSHWGVGADRAPIDGVPELTVSGGGYLFGSELALVDWPGAVVVLVDDAPEVLVYGAGAFGPDDTAIAGGIHAIELVAGDADLDGDQELVVTLDGVRVFDPPADGEFAERFHLTPGYGPSGVYAGNLGLHLGPVTDVDGDGIPDLIGHEDTDRSGLFVVPADLTGTVDRTAVGIALHGEDREGATGASIAVADLDGDGYPDVLTGAPLAEGRSGRSYAFPGPITAEADLVDGLAVFDGLAPWEACGVRAAALDDPAGGPGTVVIACDHTGDADSGRVELYRGASGAVDATAADRVLVGAACDDRFAAAIAAGDVTGDGAADLVVSALADETGGEYSWPTWCCPEAGVAAAGAIYVFSGPLVP